MRSKEEAHDYRYFPEPDLPVVLISEPMVREIAASLPEMPQARRDRFSRVYGLSDYDAGVLTSSRELGDYFEQGLQAMSVNAKTFSNWLTVELLGKLNAEGKTIGHSPVPAGNLASLIGEIESGVLSGKIGKQVFAEMYATGHDPKTIIQQLGVSQISDPQALQQLVDDVLAKHPGPVGEYRAGKIQALGFLVGQVMKNSQGQADPKKINALLRERLK
jgi:aspartyl-tRNA(Asn)/glutamyl-tRNA(Gln) amidotransferase subunit B